MNEESQLPADSILIAEFEYIVSTIAQNNEDRARVAQFYLVSFGSFIAGLVTTQLEPEKQYLTLINAGFGFLFLLLSFLGLLTVAELAQLRSAWFESVKAMNQIKQYYFDHTSDKSLQEAFLWKSIANVPKLKFKSIAFALVLQVAVVAGIAMGAAVFMLSSALGYYENYLLSLFAGVIFLGSQFLIYKWMLE